MSATTRMMAHVFILAAVQSDDVGAQVEKLLQGTNEESAQARRVLQIRGWPILPSIAAARRKDSDEAHRAALAVFAQRLKAASVPGGENDPDALAVERKLTQTRVNLAGGTVEEMLEALRAATGLNIVCDSRMPPDPLAAKCEKSAGLAARALQSILDAGGLDVDLRFRVLWVSTPERLWPRPASAALSESDAKLAREALAALAGSKDEDRESELLAKLNALGPAAAPLVEEAAIRASDLRKELALRQLLLSLRPPPAITELGTWHRQALDGTDQNTRLLGTRVTLECKGIPLSDAIDRLGKAGGITFDVPREASDAKVTVSVKDLEFFCALDLITRPLGFDSKSEKSAIRIIAPK